MQQGDRLGMYRLVDRLGRGGFAEVWRARPEPVGLEGAGPDQLRRWIRAAATLLEGRPGIAAGVAQHLAAMLELLARPDAAAPAPLEAGQLQAARTQLAWLEELARGGALDVAVKVPFHDGYVRQMRRETHILEEVRHPRLVRQLELDVAHDPPFLAMEYVQGWSLREALRTEPLPPMAKVLAVMDQLLTVLEHLHRRGIVHGDVKPENILLEPDGALRLIDLGLGQVSQAVLRDAYLSLSLASRVPLLGTLSYMAPEVRRGEPPGPAADLYSAGIVLYELLVGDVPHGMTLPSEAATTRQLTPRFDVLLKWVLHPEPARRIESAGELRERVLLLLRDRPRHTLGTGARGVAREGTQAFDQWALENASPFVAGDWVGPYQLEEPLGRGGFGEVWRARRGPDEGAIGVLPPVAPGTEVALKLAIGPHGRDGLRREAEVSARLDHPRIPAVREAALDHDPPYLAVDYARGRSLRATLVEGGRLQPADALPAISQLVAALIHCHERGVVHRDLKPENLLVDAQAGTMALLDFGLASADASEEERQRLEVSRHLDSQDPGGGTFEYMAPERRKGAPGAPPADAYAVGVILYEMLTCELPRGLTTLRELCPTAPLWLEAVCAGLLDPDPASRATLPTVAARLAEERTPLAPARPGQAADAAPRVPWRGAAVLASLTVCVAVGLLERPRAQPESRPAPRDDAREAAREAADAAGLDVVALEALERRLPAKDPASRLRAARLRSLRLRRSAAVEQTERGRQQLGHAELVRLQWLEAQRAVAPRLPPRGSTEAARLAGAGLDAGRLHLLRAQAAVAALSAALEADPTGPGVPDLHRSLRSALRLEAAWRADLVPYALRALERAGQPAHEERRAEVTAALPALGPDDLEALEAVATIAAITSGWLEAGRSWLHGRVRRGLQRGDLAGVTATLDAAAGRWELDPLLGVEVGALARRVIEHRQLLASAAAAPLDERAELLLLAARARPGPPQPEVDRAVATPLVVRLWARDVGPDLPCLAARALLQRPSDQQRAVLLAVALALAGDGVGGRGVAERAGRRGLSETVDRRARSARAVEEAVSVRRELETAWRAALPDPGADLMARLEAALETEVARRRGLEALDWILLEATLVGE